MTGSKLFALLFPVCLLLGFSVVLANDAPPASLENANGGPKRIVHVAKISVQPEPIWTDPTPSPHPRPMDPKPTLVRPGPAASGGSAFATGIGSALLSPRGAAMASPKQHADREIRKLIRSLD